MALVQSSSRDVIFDVFSVSGLSKQGPRITKACHFLFYQKPCCFPFTLLDHQFIELDSYYFLRKLTLLVLGQNHDIAHQRNGEDLTPEALAEWYMKLQEVGNVHNINLVTPEHIVPHVVLSILHARELGLKVPIVYNTSAFDSLASLELLDGLVDIFLPDFKVWHDSTSKRLLKTDNYTATAMESIKAMYDQVGDLCFTPDGIAKKGVLVRHLVMPGKEDEGVEIMKWMAKNISRDIFVNILEQYHPDAHVGKKKRSKVVEPGDVVEVRYQEINRHVEKREISAVRSAAERAGLWRFCDPPRHDGFNI